MQNKRLEELEAQKKKINEEIALLQQYGDPIFKQLKDIQLHEKVTAFDHFYKISSEYALKRIKEGWVAVEDDRQYLFETLIMTTLGDDIFTKLNRLEK